jgi:hypothetical protein
MVHLLERISQRTPNLTPACKPRKAGNRAPRACFAARHPRVAVIDELYDAVRLGRAPVHSGDWAMATVKVCLAVLASSRSRKELNGPVGLASR